MSLLLVLAVTTFAAGATLAVAEALRPRRELRASLRLAAGYGAPAAVADEGPRASSPLLGAATRLALRLAPRTRLDDLSARLAAAGLRVPAESFAALRVGLVAGGAALGLVAGLAAGSPGRAVLGAAALAALGHLLPALALTSRARRRREAIQASLPNVLDLLAVSIEAGLSLDAAVARVADHTDGPLADELAALLADIRVGESRDAALERLAERVEAPEVTAFARAVGRAERLGVSLGKTLRLQAQEARVRRQAAAEERAARAPVKMLFPTILFIFPALFVVVLGPALLTLTRMF